MQEIKLYNAQGECEAVKVKLSDVKAFIENWDSSLNTTMHWGEEAEEDQILIHGELVDIKISVDYGSGFRLGFSLWVHKLGMMLVEKSDEPAIMVGRNYAEHIDAILDMWVRYVKPGADKLLTLDPDYGKPIDYDLY